MRQIKQFSTAFVLGVLAQGAQAGLEAANVVYTGEWDHVVQGGLEEDDAYLGNLDIDLEFTFGDNDNPVRAYVYLLGNHGDDPSELVGDAQAVSNIAAPETLRLYEAWFETDVAGLSLKAGLYDVNSEFDAMEVASLFINSSFGIGPDFSQAGPMGPSIFPITGVGVRAAKSFDETYVQVAVVDGMPGDPGDERKTNFRVSKHDGALVVAELGRSGEGDDGAYYKMALGTWHFTSRFEDFDGERQRGNQGAYLLGERVLSQWGATSLSGFARVGVADDKINAVDLYTGAGLVLSGFLTDRPNDRMGIAVARAAFSEGAQVAAGINDAETTIEWTYELPVNEWLTLQPDVQYVVDPSGDGALDDALVMGLRFYLSYSQ